MWKSIFGHSYPIISLRNTDRTVIWETECIQKSIMNGVFRAESDPVWKRTGILLSFGRVWQKNDGRVPLWTIVEFFSMGMLVYFYLDMKPQDQKAIAGEIYGTGVKQLESWLHCVTELRNRCAHYLRLYYWSFPSVPKMPEGCEFQPDRGLFSQLLVLKFLYPDEREWNFKMMAVLEPLMAEYENDIELSHIGFPKDWKMLL